MAWQLFNLSSVVFIILHIVVAQIPTPGIIQVGNCLEAMFTFPTVYQWQPPPSRVNGQGWMSMGLCLTINIG